MRRLKIVAITLFALPLSNQSQADEPVTIKAQAGPVRQVAFWPDGKRSEKTVKLISAPVMIEVADARGKAVQGLKVSISFAKPRFCTASDCTTRE